MAGVHLGMLPDYEDDDEKVFLNARPYASAVYAVDVCPSVCPSVCHKSEYYQNGRTNRAGFGLGTFFDLSYN